MSRFIYTGLYIILITLGVMYFKEIKNKIVLYLKKRNGSKY